MWLGHGRILLDDYGNEKSAKKHRQLEELCKKLRKEFNLSILEVDQEEDPENCELGFAVVMPDRWEHEEARRFVEKICRRIDELAVARVTLEDWDVQRVRGTD